MDLATVVEDLVGRAAAGAGGPMIVRSDRPSSIFVPNRNLRNRIGDVGQQAQRPPRRLERVSLIAPQALARA